VTVEVNDTTIAPEPNDSAALAISVTDVNESPTVALANTTTTFPENTDTTARIKVGDIVVTDDALGTNDLALSGADSSLFEIDGTELYLSAGVSLDFETNASLDVNVEVNDATIAPEPNDTAALAITVTDVNEAPTVALANTTTTFPEDADTTARIKVADIVVTDDALGTNDLVLSGADAGLFEIDGAELYLSAGAGLDFESNPSLDVNVEVNDTTIAPAPNDTAALAISVTDINEVPTVALANTTTTMGEDTDTTARIKVADIVVTDDALGTNDLALSGADAGLFEIDGTELFLSAGETLDFETNATLDVNVEVNDTAIAPAPNDITALAISVTDVNEAPAVALANTTTTFPEDADTSVRVKVADIVVTDDALGTNDLALTGDDVGLFEIDGTGLFLNAGASLDFETNATLDVNVEVNDATIAPAPNDTESLAITVTDVADDPIPPEPTEPEPDHPEPVDQDPPSPSIPDVPAPDNPTPDPVEPDAIPPIILTPDDTPPVNPEPVDPEGNEPDPVEPDPVEPDPVEPDPNEPDPNEPEPSGVKPDNSDQGDPVAPQPDVSAVGDGSEAPHVAGKGQVAPSVDTKAAAYARADALLENKPIWDNLGVVQQQMQEVNELEERELAITVGTVEGFTAFTLAGYVVWIFRGGALLSGILATMPIWKGFDPLPILDLSDKRRKKLRKKLRKQQRGRWRKDEVADDDAELSWLVDSAECRTKGEK
jgi:hypothetical protein